MEEDLVYTKWEAEFRALLTYYAGWLTEKIKDTTIQASISYDENKDLQRQGKDIVAIPQKQIMKQFMFITNILDTSLEVKTREHYAHRFNDVLLETAHFELGTGRFREKGWFYLTEAKIVGYCWLSVHSDELYDGVLLIMNQEIREWFEPKKERYETKTAYTKEGWYTENKAVPITDFPESTLHNIPQIVFQEFYRLKREAEKKQGQQKLF